MRTLTILAASVALSFPSVAEARVKPKQYDCSFYRSTQEYARECTYQGDGGREGQARNKPAKDKPSKPEPSKPDKEPPSKPEKPSKPDKPDGPGKDPGNGGCGDAMLKPGAVLACGPGPGPGCGDAMLFRPGDVLACGRGGRESKNG